MSASDNLGPQWMRVYRGLHDVSWDTVEDDSKDRPLGIHWTTSYPVAEVFAQYGTTRPHRNAEGGEGAVLTGIVHRRHIIGKDDPDAVDHGVYPEWHPDAAREREVTLRRGAPVHLRSIRQKAEPWEYEDSSDDDEYEDNSVDLPLSRKSVRRA